MIKFCCNQCGHDAEVDDSFAGQANRCQRCGHEMIVSSGGFRLQPIPDEEEEARSGAPSIEPYELLGDEPPPAVLEPSDHLDSDPGDAPAESGSIPEEFLADRAPIAFDEEGAADEDDGPIALSE